eukprot:2941960-Rhodomonas_salina.3
MPGTAIAHGVWCWFAMRGTELASMLAPARRNQAQSPAFLVQTVLMLWFLAFDSGQVVNDLSLDAAQAPTPYEVCA